MNQRAFSVHPGMVVRSFWHNRYLIWQMTRRDVTGRYRGSMMGLLWSLMTPLLMLAVYTFVFGIIFPARVGGQSAGMADFAVFLFSGLIIHGLFSECVTRAPGLVLGNVNYVKKVVFPLEILPWTVAGSALFHAAISVLVLLVFYGAHHAVLHWTVLFLPLILLPFILMVTGFSWFLASLGVFVRDVGQAIGIISTAMLFLSPVFYRLESIPAQWRDFLYLNPLTFIIGQTRAILLRGEMPDWSGLGLYTALSIVIAWLGLVWFQKTRKGFADVL